MPLTPPNLDRRTFEDLVAEARLRATRFTPEWTDFNPGDPGAAMIDLFAWMTEIILFRLNQVPDRNYAKFLRMLDLELRPAKPAETQLTFVVNPNANLKGLLQTVLKGTQVAGQHPENGDLITFETDDDLELIPFNLEAVQVFDGASFRDVTTQNVDQGVTFRPFGLSPQVDSALYLGFGPLDDPKVESDAPPAIPARLRELKRRFPGKMLMRIVLPEDGDDPESQRAGPSEQRVSMATRGRPSPLMQSVFDLLKDERLALKNPSTQWYEQREVLLEGLSAMFDTGVAGPMPDSVTVQWEYRSINDPTHWSRLEPFTDTSNALTKEGTLNLEGPLDIIPSLEGRVRDQYLYWIRGRVVSGRYPAGRAPNIDIIRPNTVAAKNLATDRGFILAISNGLPDQAHRLRNNPVDESSLKIDVETPGGELVEWIRTDDLRAAKSTDPFFTLNANTGVVTFGSGTRGLIPPLDNTIIAREYRHGGGARGNLAQGQINVLLTDIPSVESVSNERAAVGGNDEQTIDELKGEAPHILRRRNRAVTHEDFASLALESGGIARATAIALAHPDHPGVPVPGCLTVIVVPDSENVPPRPTSELLRSVADHLDKYRLITTEVHVDEPAFYGIKVTARITVASNASFGRVREEVVDALKKHLSPVAIGEEDGWSFGRDLFPTELYNAFLNHPDVRGVENLEIAVNGRTHRDLDEPVQLPPDGLVYSDPHHDITIGPDVDL